MSGTGAPTRSGHVVVCGLAGLGVRIVEELTHAGEDVVVVDRVGETQLAHVVTGWGVDCLAPQGTLSETLIAAGVLTAAAVVCVEHGDLRNLETALLARELRPDVRVVSQLGSTAVRRAVEVDSGPGAVLDVAHLAAPSVVEACLGASTHRVDVPGVDFAAATVPVTAAGTLRSHFGDLAPIAVVRAPAAGEGRSGEADVVVCPGRDLELAAGDLATVLGTRAELAGHEPLAPRVRRQDRLAPPGPVARAGQSLRALRADLDPGLYRAVLALVTLITVSTMVLSWGYDNPGMSPLDAVYFSAETISTVGYGDFSFVGQAPWLRIWAIFLMLSGITTTAVLMAFLADLLISRRLDRSVGRRAAQSMAGHVVVVGVGSFGVRVVAELLDAGRDVVVLERDENNRSLGRLAELGVPVVFGDATATSALLAARVDHASAVAVLTSDDMVNIETGLAVRDLLGDAWWGENRTHDGALLDTGVPVVLRVFDRSLGRTVARRFGFRHVRSTEELTAPWFVGAALGLDVLGTFTVEQQLFLVGGHTVAAGGGLAGAAMHELSAHTRIVAIKRADTGEVEHPPRRGTRLQAGDEAYLVGPHTELLEVLRRGRAGASAAEPAPAS